MANGSSTKMARETSAQFRDGGVLEPDSYAKLDELIR